MKELKLARCLTKVLGDSRWLGVQLARAYLGLARNDSNEAIAREIYQSGCMTLKKAKEILPGMKESGFMTLIPPRRKLGSAENPITKLFPAAITEQRFLVEIDSLRSDLRSVDYVDDRFSGHTLTDFTLKEDDLVLPINVKNAGTRFENARQLVSLDPDDCIPIPVYKAYDAIEKEPNLIYAISVDYSLLEKIRKHLVPQFNEEEGATWNVLNSCSGTRIRDAEDKFIYGMTIKYWETIQPHIADSPFRIISARKSIRILQKLPKRTPGVGLRAWGTGASAEVNVHISVGDETKPWHEIRNRIIKGGLADIVHAINRKRTETVYDPEI